MIDIKSWIFNLITRKNATWRYNIGYSHIACHVPKSTRFYHKGLGVVISSRTRLGENIHIYQNVTIGGRGDGSYDHPVIDDNVKIFAGSSVLGDVHVGKNSVVGAYALVLDDVPPDSVVVGIPAKVVKK